MAYHVQTAEGVERYILAIDGLSHAGKQRVIQGYLDDLARDADHFLQRYPLSHESYSFEYEFALVDSGQIHSFRFIADGTHMAMGVVQVVYVDHVSTPLP